MSETLLFFVCEECGRNANPWLRTMDTFFVRQKKKKKRRLPPLLFHEEATAALRETQRWARGALTRKRLWDPLGNKETNAVAQRAAKRLQRRWRGLLGRRKAQRRLHEKRRWAATVLTALVRGHFGRNDAKLRRVAEGDVAASHLQRCYRGRLGKRFFDLYKEEDKKRKATRIQRTFRGIQGRKIAKRCLLKMSSADDRAARFEPFIRRMLFNQKHNPSELPEDGVLGAAVAFSSGILEAIHSLITDALLYDQASELLKLARHQNPDDPSVWYASAIVAAVSWPAATSFKVRKPRLLEDAVSFAKSAAALDPKGSAYDDWWNAYYVPARRRHPRRPSMLCLYAVAKHVVYGRDFIMQCRGRTNNNNSAVLRQSEAIFRRATHLAEIAPPEEREAIDACFSAFTALWQRGLKRVPKLRTRFTTHRGTTWMLEIFQGHHFVVCTGRTSKPNTSRRELTPSIFQEAFFIVPPEEISFLENLLETGAFDDDPIPIDDHSSLATATTKKKKKQQKRPASVAELLLRELVMTSSSLVIPGLVRLRARWAQRKVEEVCATRLVRAYKGFDQRAFFKRAIFRLRQRELQAAKLAVQRAKKHLERLEIKRLVAKAQAEARGFQTRRLAAILRFSIVLIQKKLRVVAARIRREAEERRKLLEGPEVAPVVQRKPVIVSGISLLLTVHHCGLNFKFVGYDLRERRTYVGFCYSDVLRTLIDDVNSRRRTQKIRPYEYRRILGDVILDRLAVVPAIPTLLSNHDDTVIVVLPPQKKATERTSSLQMTNLARGLRDGMPSLRSHDRKVETHRKARLARGLPREDPPVPQQTKAIAAMRFKMRLNS